MHELPETRESLIARVKDPADAVAWGEFLEDCLAHVQQPTAVPLPEPLRDEEASATAGKRRWPIRRLLAGAAFVLALLFAGVLVVLQLNKGTLMIESSADDVAVRVTQGDAVVEKLTVTQAGKRVRVAAGTYVVEVEGEADGFTVENGTVTLQRGGTEIVRIVRRSAADDSRELLVTHSAARVVGLDRKAALNLPEREIRHQFDELVEVDRLLTEGTPLFKDGNLAGLTLLGRRFLGDKARKSYVVPQLRIRVSA